MTRTLRVAILECDTPIDPVKARYGTYGDLFEGLLQESLNSLPKISGNITLHTSKWNVVENPVYPPLADFDAVLITGSSTSVKNPLSTNFLT